VRVSRRLHVPVDLPLRAMSDVALTDEQAQAVLRRRGSLLLSAAAGSGKTSVLVERFVAAVREDGIAPARILAITFTERAAGELRSRVRARLLELGEREAARDTEAAFVGTFHGFCARLLRANALLAGLDPDFAILDEGLAGRLRGRAFTAALREFAAGERADAVDLLAAYGVDRVRTMIEQAYDELRSRGEVAPRLPVPAAGDLSDACPERGDGRDEDAVRALALLDELLGGFGRAYARLKRERSAVDFDDLELRARELLVEHARVRAGWAERFELLMVDEFQDTNPRQLGILTALERGNLFTVGDELQSIYAFRHADVSLFRARRAAMEELGASLRLTRNFRSREAVLDAVNAVFAGRFAGYTPLVASRERERLAGEHSPAHEQHATGAPVELLLTDARGWEEVAARTPALAAGLPDTQPWRQAEARMLAQRVGELVERGHARAGEVVVLLRALGDLEVFERALRQRGLRTLASVGSFWAHQQVSDLVCYLRALANPLDEQALHGVLASPFAGCSLDCLALLAAGARERRASVWETALATARDRRGSALAHADAAALACFCEWFPRERAGAPRRAIAELMRRAIAASGYREHVLAQDWPQRRMANVHKLARLARRFEAQEGRDLRAFLDHVAYLQQTAAEPDAPVDATAISRAGAEHTEPDAVRLMTVHAAKGLEFPVVCVADLGRQPNTQTPDLLVGPSPQADGERAGLRLARLDGSASRPALDYERLCAERREREALEEDRILYVAMTRARERLLLSGAVDFARWPAARQAQAAIAWLAPALCPQLPALAGGATAPLYDLAIEAREGVNMRLWLNSPAGVGSVLRLDEPAAAPPAGPAVSEPRGGPPEGEQLSLLAGVKPPPQHHININNINNRNNVLPSALSYTSLSELERCGYRYYLERVLVLPEDRAAARGGDRRRGLDARARGTLVHQLMESLDFARLRAITPADVAAAARALALSVGERERAEIAGLVATAAAAEPAARLAAARSVRREHHFAFSLADDQPLVSGVIDVLAEEGDGERLVVDYKSDRVGAAESLFELVERDYALQREIYALAMLRAGAASVTVLHWFLQRPHEPVGARYGAEQRLQLEAALLERLAGVRARGFAVSDEPHRELCLTCPGRGTLCSWPEAEALRKNPRSALGAEPLR
jgi:ATP-dependent helicase/nuclease subunit A